MVDKDLEDLIVDNPTKEDYKKLGEYLIRRKISNIKMKWYRFRRLFHGNKGKADD